MAETFGMRPSNKQRSRNKPGNSNSNHNNNNNNNQRRSVGNIINRVFESAGPDGKVRGTPQQIIDKYQALGRDAQVAGDRVAAESFLQHAEHYSRMLGEAQRQQAEMRVGQDREDGQRFDGQPQQQQPQQQPQRQDHGRGNDSAPEREHSGGMDYSSSGMATIDASEADYGAGGLIETPEGRSEPPVAFAVAPEPAAQTETAEVNGGHAAEAEEPRPAPARRGRPRRTSRSGEPAAAAD